MQIKQFLIAVCIGLMFAACSNSEDYFNSDDNVIRLTAQIEGMKTRVATNGNNLHKSWFEMDETISVYIKKTDGSNVEGISGNCATYTVDDTGRMWSTETPLYPDDGSSVNIYALYPSSFTNTQTSFSVKNDQSSPEDYLASDLMCAVKAGVSKSPAGPITLSFKHCLSKVILKIVTTGTDLVATDATSIYMDGARTSISLTQNQTTGITLGSPTGGNSGSIKMGETYSEGGLAAIVVPQTISSGQMIFDFVLNGNICVYASQDITFEPGCVHTITVTVNNDNVAITNYEITDWTPGTNYDNEEGIYE